MFYSSAVSARPAAAPQGLGLVALLLLALVAGLFPASAYAISVDDFLKAQPPNTIASQYRLKPYIKPPGGGTGIRLFKTVAGGPWAVGAAAALTVGTIYFEDELNMTLNEMFLGSEQPPTPEGWIDPVTPPAGGSPNFYMATSGAWDLVHTGQTELEACKSHYSSWTYLGNGWPSGSLGNCRNSGGNYSGAYVQGPYTCATYPTAASCVANPPGDPNATWEEDGISMTKIENGQLGFWSPETETFTASNPMYYNTPEGIGMFSIDPAGNLILKEYTGKTDADGNISTVIEEMKVDTTNGTILETSQKTVANQTPVEAANGDAPTATQSVQVTFPDSMNVTVDETGTPTAPAAGSDNYGGNGFTDLTNSMNTVAEPPLLNPLPSLPNYSGSCQTVTYGYGQHMVTFPSVSQCSKMGELKDLLAWFLYIVTAWLLWEIALGARKGT